VFSGTIDFGRVGRKVARKHLEKSVPLLRVHRVVIRDDLLREYRLRSFAALGEQMAAQETHVRALRLAQHSQQIGEKSGHGPLLL